MMGTALDYSRWPNFSYREMACHCGCGRADMDPGFMDLLQILRNVYGKPMVVSSGYRCPEHNVRVSTTGPNGPHTTGKAADILVYGQHARELMRLVFTNWPFNFIGLGVNQKGPHRQRFLHLDVVSETVWSY
jgi:zinc D-Ala-D-Ala carboxypeptidase